MNMNKLSSKDICSITMLLLIVLPLFETETTMMLVKHFPKEPFSITEMYTKYVNMYVNTKMYLKENGYKILTAVVLTIIAGLYSGFAFWFYQNMSTIVQAYKAFTMAKTLSSM